MRNYQLQTYIDGNVSLVHFEDQPSGKYPYLPWSSCMVHPATQYLLQLPRVSCISHQRDQVQSLGMGKLCKYDYILERKVSQVALLRF
jgi:hypothetical protein